MLNTALIELREIINEKWTQEQVGAYLKFIDDYLLYINEWVYAGQVGCLEDYEAWKEAISTYNPVGAGLFEKQLVYVEKIRKGEPIFDKKKNKGNKAPQQQAKVEVKYKPIEETERVVIRKHDPEINLEKLWGAKWDSKYVDLDFLAKQNVNIVFIGHVDSGKSTLTGNIIKELKEIDEQELTKAKQDSANNKMQAW